MAEPGIFLKSVIEELCYAGACNVDAVEEFTGTKAPRVRLTGGVARNKEFVRILSNTCGRDVTASLDPDGTLVGVAVCCMVGSGQHPSLVDACRKKNLLGPTVSPDDTSQDYLEQKGRWRELYFRMLELAEDGKL